MLRLSFFVAIVSVGCASRVYISSNELIDLTAPVATAGKIVGGEETTIEDVPYQVALLYVGFVLCGGSIVRSNAIVTAGHCTFRIAPSEVSFRIGSSNHDVGGQVIPSRCIFVEENYEGGLDYDISLVELSRDIIFSASAAPAALAPRELEVPVGTYAVTSGWGRTSFGGPSSNIIRKVMVPIIDQDICKKAYGTRITPRMICAGFTEGGKDACRGDSGGPLVLNNTLIGVTSWGVGCAAPGHPGVWARVSEMRDWLDDKLLQIPQK